MNHEVLRPIALGVLLDERMQERWVLECLGERLFAPTDVASELALPPLHVKSVRQGDRWHADEAGVAALRIPSGGLGHRDRRGSSGNERLGRCRAAERGQCGDHGQRR